MKFDDILQSLYDHKVRYLIIGGVALNLHGVIRMTNDLDIMLDFSSENFTNFTSAMNDLNFVPRVPEPLEKLADEHQRELWYKEKNMKAFALYNPKDPFYLLDVLLKPVVDFDQAYARKEEMSFKNVKISVVSCEDIVDLKKDSGRAKDQYDIAAISQVRKMKEDPQRYGL